MPADDVTSSGSAQQQPYEPSAAWRFGSSTVMGVVGALCRSFLYGLNTTHANGLDRFLEILDSRADESQRQRGLLTVCNHTSVMDDPLIWGVLPYAYHWHPSNLRWSLGSYDICFKDGESAILSKFFTLGNTLPTQRSQHSQFGGLFQPTMTEAIRLLSNPWRATGGAAEWQAASTSFATSDPFSSNHLTFSTNGTDCFPSPSAYPSRRYNWVHIFPEGMIHQHPSKLMRYFKWGVARLILESEPCPDVVPMWIDGCQDVMSELRTFPRPVPRIGKTIEVTFGELVDVEKVFGPFRKRWASLKEKAAAARRENLLTSGAATADEDAQSIERLGVVEDEELRYGEEAQKLRMEVTMAVRNEVLKVRRSRGLPDEDPKFGRAETWLREGKSREGVMKDDSVVKEM